MGDLFDQFWAQYPRRIARRMAEKAFSKLTEEEQRKAVAVLPMQVRAWRHTEKRFIPYASTWLNQGRFDDEVEVELTPNEKWMEALYGHGNGGAPAIRRVQPGLGSSGDGSPMACGDSAKRDRDLDPPA